MTATGRGVVPLLCSAGLHAALGAWLVAVSGAGGLRPLVVDLTAPEPLPASVTAPSPAPASPAPAATRAPASDPAIARSPKQAAATRHPAPAAAPPRATEPAPRVEARPTAPPEPSTPAVQAAPVPDAVPVATPAAETPVRPAAAPPASPPTATDSSQAVPQRRERGESGASGLSTGGSSTSGGPATALARPSPAPGDGRAAVPPEYGPYLARFRAAVQAELRYPLSARRRGVAGSVELEVAIAPDGRVSGVTVVSSSSHQELDEAAADAVRRLRPIPIPAHLPQRALIVRLPLVFDLR